MKEATKIIRKISPYIANAILDFHIEICSAHTDLKFTWNSQNKAWKLSNQFILLANA